MRCMIAAAVMFCDLAVKVFSGADTMSTGSATQNIDPSHDRIGSAGTRTRNQRLKRALLYRLSYRPISFYLSTCPVSRWQPTPKAFGAALPIELPTRAEKKFLIQFKRCCKVCS